MYIITSPYDNPVMDENASFTMKKLRTREFKDFAQEHIARK